MVSYARLNLLRNPFGQLAPQELAALAIVDASDLLAWLSGGGRALQLVGPPGRGKSTHLRALAAALPRATWLRPSEEGALDAPARMELALLDDAQRLADRALASLLVRAGSIALASHRCREGLLRLAGLAVRTIALPPPAPALLRSVAAARIEAARRGEGPVPDVSLGTCARLLETHAGDLHAALDDLYDRLQELPGVATL